MPEYWDVIYRAEADFDDLMRAAAEAEAALKSMAAAADTASARQADAARQAAAAWDTDIARLRTLGDTMRTLQSNADLYNQRVLFAGRSSMEQHLSDISRETTEQTLLNRARQRGLYSVQEDYMWRQRELQQAYLWNIAQQRGFASYDQYLNAMQKERIAFEAFNTAMARRIALEQAATSAALAHADAQAGSHASLSQLSETTSTYNDVLNSLPDVVSTQAMFDDGEALRDAATYLASLHGIPQEVTTRLRLVVPGTDAMSVTGPREVQPGGFLSGESLAQMSAAMAAMHGEAEAAGQAAGAVAAFSAAEKDAGYSAEFLAARQKLVTDALLASMAAGRGAEGGGGGGFLAGFLSGGHGGGGGGGVAGFWGGMIAGVAAWHVALDGIIEAFISITLAAAALGTGMAALVETSYDIFTHLQAVQAVAASLDQYIRPLTGAFDKVAISLVPQGIEIYGGALSALTQNAAAFGRVAQQVVTLFDTWIAKIDIWAQSNGNFSRLLQSGVGYLSQFGKIIGTLVEALGNLLREDPGIARFLLDIIQGFASLLNVATRVSPGLVELALALHGLFVWGNVLIAPLLRLAGALGILDAAQLKATRSALGFTNVLKTTITSPWGWLAVAAASIAFFTVRASHGTETAQRFVNAINQRIDNEKASSAILDISNSIAQLNQQIAHTTAGSELRNMFSGSFTTQLRKTFTQDIPDYVLGIGHAFEHLGDEVAHGGISGALHGLEGLAKAVFTNSGASAEAASIDISVYRGEITKLLTEQSNLFAETGNLMRGTQGLSASQQAAAMQAKRQGVELDMASHSSMSFASALTLMDMAGVRANDSLGVMAQKVANLIHGYYEMGVQGGILSNSVNAVSFASLQQQSQISKLTQGWDTFFKTVTSGESGFVSLAQNMQSLDQATGKSNVSMTGLNANSLAARNQFLQTASAAQQELDNLYTLSSAAGEGAKGTAMLTKAAQDMVKELLPAAQHSQTLRDALYTLAQQGGYRGANSFQALTTWVTNVQHPMENLQGIETRLSNASATLVKDVQNLSIALGTTLTQAEASAIQQATGGTTALNNFATAVLKDHDTLQQMQPTADKVINQFLVMSKNANDAQAQFQAFAIDGLNLTKQQADQLWQTFINQKLTQAASQAGETKNAFITLATQLGKTRTQADNLWTSLHKVAAGSPYDARVSVSGIGHWSISEALRNIGGAHGAAGFGGAAEGGYMGPATGGAKADDKIIAVSGGEYVVQAAAVSKYGQGMMDAINAGRFQGGGPVPVTVVSGSDTGNPQQLGSWAGQEFAKTVHAVAQDTAAATFQGIKQAQQSAAAAGITEGGHAVARGQYGLAALENLWMQAGGPGGYIARIAAAIALAESGGNPNARNPSGASGLWQILGQVYPGNIFSPFINALNAVRKFDEAGHSFRPWVTYETGAYRAFLAEGGPVALASGGALDKHHVGKYTSQHSAYGRAYDEVLSRERDESVAFWRLFGHEPWRLQHAAYQGDYFGLSHADRDEAQALGRLRQEHGSLLWYTRQLANDAPDRFPAHRWTNWRNELFKMGQDLDRDDSLRRRHPGYYNDLRWRERALHTAVDHLQAEWQRVMHARPPHLHAPASIHGLPTHGIVPTLDAPGIADVVTDLLPTGPRGLAAGGPVASLFSGGLGTMSPTVPAFGLSLRGLAGGGPATNVTETSRSLSPAGVEGKGATVTIGDVIVNNPIPEQASDGITRGVQKAAFLAARGLA